MKTLALYLASLKAALRYLALLLCVVILLAVVVFASLPKSLFDSHSIPSVNLALVLEGTSEDNSLGRALTSQLNGVDVLGELYVCNEDEAEELLDEAAVDAVVTLPEDMLNALVYGGHAKITVKAYDPLLGAVVFSVVEQAVEALDAIQNYSLVYASAARDHFSSSSERDDAINAFNFKLMNSALSRLSSVDEVYTVSPFYSQVLSLLLFITVSIGSFFIAVITAQQYSSGYLRHLRQRGVGFVPLLISQLLLSVTLALILSLVCGIAMLSVDSSANIGLLMISAVLLSLVLTPLYLLFSGFKQKEGAAATRTLLGCSALLFFLLFAGGGFYPSFLMESPLRIINPTWMSQLLAEWTLGAAFDGLGVLLFAAVFASAALGCFLEWKRAT